MHLARAHPLLLLTVAACLVAGVSPRPANNESGPLKFEMAGEEAETEREANKEERSIYYQSDPGTETGDETTRDIVDKIKAINDGLKKPNRHQITHNKPPATEYVIDKDILEKIQQAIAAGKLHTSTYGSTQRLQDTNEILRDDEITDRLLSSRAIPVARNVATSQVVPYPYIVPVPIMVMPQSFDAQNQIAINNEINSFSPYPMFQTRQESPFPNFPSFSSLQSIFRWPFAQFFPLIVKDPFLTFSQSGGWNNLIEYGQNADVCSRKQKSANQPDSTGENDFNDRDTDVAGNMRVDLADEPSQRRARALKKRNVNQRSSAQDVDADKQFKKIYVSTKPIPTNTKIKATKKPIIVQEIEEVKNEESGDLRFPFGDFSWFGNRKPVAPSPGFFINKLRVRKGGVAIAGPGGVATAGRGGTAIVGPGGLAYTQPGGLAVAGPAARVVALPPDADLHALVRRLLRDDPSVPRATQPIREGKLVATGPVVFYHPTEQTYPGVEERSSKEDEGQSVMDVYYYDGHKLVPAAGSVGSDAGFVLQLSPEALAVSGARGAAIANPVSQVYLAQGGASGTIAHRPRATALAGPGGIAHALSELYVYSTRTS